MGGGGGGGGVMIMFVVALFLGWCCSELNDRVKVICSSLWREVPSYQIM